MKNETNENTPHNYEDTVKYLLRATMRYSTTDKEFVDGVLVRTERVYDVKRINKDVVTNTSGTKHYYYYVFPLHEDGTPYNDEEIQAETRKYNDALNARLRAERIERESNNEVVLSFVAALPDTLNAPVQDGDPWDSKFQHIEVTPRVWYNDGYGSHSGSYVALTLAYDYDENRNPIQCRAYTPHQYADGKTWRTWDSTQIRRTNDSDSGKVYFLTFDGIEYVTDYELRNMLSDCGDDFELCAYMFNTGLSEGRIELYVKPEDKIKSLSTLASLNGRAPEPGKLYRLF